MTGPEAPSDEKFESQLRRALRRDGYSRAMPPESLLLERVQATLATDRRWRMVAFVATAAFAAVFVIAGIGLTSRLTWPGIIAQGASPSQFATRSAELASQAASQQPTVEQTTVSAAPSGTAEASAPPPSLVPALPLFAHEPGSPGFLARATGVLAYDENGCLVLNADGGATLYLAWPSPGTDWDPVNGTVTVDGATAELGSRVALGGGEMGVPPPESAFWVNPPVDSCWQREYYLVFIVTGDD